MGVFIGAIVADKRFPETKLGRITEINYDTHTAIIDTGKGIRIAPLSMLVTIDRNRGKE